MISENNALDLAEKCSVVLLFLISCDYTENGTRVESGRINHSQNSSPPRLRRIPLTSAAVGRPARFAIKRKSRSFPCPTSLSTEMENLMYKEMYIHN